MQNSLIEGLKEMARVAVIAALPIIIAGVNTGTGVFAVNWQIVGAAVIMSVLKGVDKWVHTEPSIDTGTWKGLLPF